MRQLTLSKSMSQLCGSFCHDKSWLEFQRDFIFLLLSYGIYERILLLFQWHNFQIFPKIAALFWIRFLLHHSSNYRILLVSDKHNVFVVFTSSYALVCIRRKLGNIIKTLDARIEFRCHRQWWDLVNTLVCSFIALWIINSKLFEIFSHLFWALFHKLVSFALN